MMLAVQADRRKIPSSSGRSVRCFLLTGCLKIVVSAILADVEPRRPARRKKRRPAVNLVSISIASARRAILSGRQDAGLYGRRDARRYIFRHALSCNA